VESILWWHLILCKICSPWLNTRKQIIVRRIFQEETRNLSTGMVQHPTQRTLSGGITNHTSD